MKRKSKEKHKAEESHEVSNKESKAKKEQDSREQAQIESLQTEKDELFEKLQRVSADYANFQKRSARQISEAIAYEKEIIIKSLLPALDNFEHTLQNAGSVEDMDTLIKGVKIIYDQMLDILKSHGVEMLNAKDQKFDPALHEAMMQQFEPDKQDNIILQEFQRGYKLNGRVIRPSKVIVNKIPTQQEKPDLQDETSDEDTAGEQE